MIAGLGRVTYKTVALNVTAFVIAKGCKRLDMQIKFQFTQYTQVLITSCALKFCAVQNEVHYIVHSLLVSILQRFRANV